MIDVCQDCPVRLFNTKHHNLSGYGNINSSNLIIVPNVDYGAYKKGRMEYGEQVRIIRDTLPTSGESEDFYLVPLIRCNTDISCEIDNSIINRCLTYTNEDISRYGFVNILLLGQTAKMICDDIYNNINNVFVYPRFRKRYFVNYSPFVKLLDDNKFDTFKHHLNKWYDSVTNKNYDNYETVIR